jgi:membrane-bound lytic murein transglycosylase D
MHTRNQTILSFALLAVAITTVGCGINQQSRFQTSFLPPAAHTDRAMADPEAPALAAEPNLYLKDVPAFLITPMTLPPPKTRGDSLVQRAERRLEAGKKYYQANDIANARREFDQAIDLMLDASDLNPADRQDYQRRTEEMVDTIHKMDLAGMGASAAPEEGKFEKAPLEDILQMTFPVDPKLRDRVREQVAATVSQLPLSVTDAVAGYINYFSTHGHRTIVAATERSGRYRPMIQRILDEEGVPQELIHLAQAESGFIPRAVSRMAAVGMWQFVKSRGNEYGLTQTAYSDDRMDPEKATRAAARHLRDLYQEFGDWYLAIAAYNCGPVVVEKAVERTGYADIWELRSRGVLPAETTNYVPIILAMTIMEKNAAEYGLDNLQLDPPLEYDTIEVSAPTSLALIADLADISPAEMAALNPAILKSVAPGGYSLHVPKGGGMQVAASLQLVPSERRASWRMHRVETGETLAAIGRRFGVAPASIATANNLQSHEASQGDQLLIPAALRAEPAAKHAAKHAATHAATHTAARHTAAASRTSHRTAVVKHAHKKPVIVAKNTVR